MSDIQHKDIRFDCNMKEDIKREYTDLIRQRGYIKKNKDNGENYHVKKGWRSAS